MNHGGLLFFSSLVVVACSSDPSVAPGAAGVDAGDASPVDSHGEARDAGDAGDAGTRTGTGAPAPGSDARCPPVYWQGCNQPCTDPGLRCTYPDEGDAPGTPAYAECFPVPIAADAGDDAGDAGARAPEGFWRCMQ